MYFPGSSAFLIRTLIWKETKELLKKHLMRLRLWPMGQDPRKSSKRCVQCVLGLNFAYPDLFSKVYPDSRGIPPNFGLLSGL